MCNECLKGKSLAQDQANQQVQHGADNDLYLSEQARILWVDDDIVIHAMAKKLLEGSEYDLHLAESGQEALDLLQRHTFDLMITDLGMPRMSGWQLANRIKGKYPAMKVAILTGLNYEITPQIMDQYDISYAVQKPISKENAVDMIREVMDDK